jgi:hypothetical protein
MVQLFGSVHLKRLTVAVLLVGCSEKQVGIYNTPPGVDLQQPVSGQVFDPGEPIHFEGIVTDSEESADMLSVQWESSVDGVIDNGAADSLGLVSFDSSVLGDGIHAVTLSAVDNQGQRAEMTVEIAVNNPDGLPGDKPVVEIDAPVDANIHLMMEPLELVGTVFDADQAPETLSVSLSSSLDGLLWEGSSDETGLVLAEVVDPLSEGNHTLTLMAVDDDIRRGKAKVDIIVTADGDPYVSITSPGDGDYFWVTDTITLQASVSDDLTPPENILVKWVSSLDGDLDAGHAGSSGTATFLATLTAGFHDILLRATDSDGNTTVEAINIEVRDPLAHDGDLDGYSELDGDCDDTDPYTHPAAIDVCDDTDNNCDGRINDADWDAQEPSDTIADAIDAGTVDGSIIIDSDEWTMGGLTLHHSSDEDWIVFDADDDIYDNVSLSVSIGLMPTGGSYLAELFLLSESSTVPVDSASGSGRLLLNYTGDPWSGGEDDFAIRISSMSWPSGSCSNSYSVDIVN